MIVDFLYKLFYHIFSFLLEISPYLIIGFLFSGVLSVLLTVETVTKYLGSKKYYSVFSLIFSLLSIILTALPPIIPDTKAIIGLYIAKIGPSKL